MCLPCCVDKRWHLSSDLIIWHWETEHKVKYWAVSWSQWINRVRVSDQSQQFMQRQLTKCLMHDQNRAVETQQSVMIIWEKNTDSHRKMTELKAKMKKNEKAVRDSQSLYLKKAVSELRQSTLSDKTVSNSMWVQLN